MTDCDAIRREVIDGLIGRAEEHAAGHERLRRSAAEHGRHDMADRAMARQDAWLEVARMLRMGEV